MISPLHGLRLLQQGDSPHEVGMHGIDVVADERQPGNQCEVVLELLDDQPVLHVGQATWLRMDAPLQRTRRVIRHLVEAKGCPLCFVLHGEDQYPGLNEPYRRVVHAHQSVVTMITAFPAARRLAVELPIECRGNATD